MEIVETVRIHTAEAPEPCYICLPPVFSTLFYPCCLMLDFSNQNPPTSTSVPESRQNSIQRFKFEIQNIEEDICHFLPNL